MKKKILYLQVGRSELTWDADRTSILVAMQLLVN